MISEDHPLKEEFNDINRTILSVIGDEGIDGFRGHRYKIPLYQLRNLTLSEPSGDIYQYSCMINLIYDMDPYFSDLLYKKENWKILKELSDQLKKAIDNFMVSRTISLQRNRHIIRENGPLWAYSSGSSSGDNYTFTLFQESFKTLHVNLYHVWSDDPYEDLKKWSPK